MTISSFAIRNVVSAYRRQLREQTPRGPSEADEPPEDDAGDPAPPGHRVRERFGDDAVREFRNASLDASRAIQDP